MGASFFTLLLFPPAVFLIPLGFLWMVFSTKGDAEFHIQRPWLTITRNQKTRRIPLTGIQDASFVMTAGSSSSNRETVEAFGELVLKLPHKTIRVDNLICCHQPSLGIFYRTGTTPGPEDYEWIRQVLKHEGERSRQAGGQQEVPMSLRQTTEKGLT